LSFHHRLTAFPAHHHSIRSSYRILTSCQQIHLTEEQNLIAKNPWLTALCSSLSTYFSTTTKILSKIKMNIRVLTYHPRWAINCASLQEHFILYPESMTQVNAQRHLAGRFQCTITVTQGP
jgi:hypothetical protein